MLLCGFCNILSVLLLLLPSDGGWTVCWTWRWWLWSHENDQLPVLTWTLMIGRLLLLAWSLVPQSLVDAHSLIVYAHSLQFRAHSPVGVRITDTWLPWHSACRMCPVECVSRLCQTPMMCVKQTGREIEVKTCSLLCVYLSFRSCLTELAVLCIQR